MASRATSRRTGSKPDRIDRLGRVVDDEVDAGGLLEGPDVASLAADDPALHLVRRQVDDRDGVLGRVVGGDPLDGGHDDVASPILGVLAGRPLDRAGDLDCVVLGLFPDGLDEDALGVLRRHPGHAFECGDLLAVGAGQVLAGLVEFPLAFEELAIALLEHVRALIELFVALEQAALEPGQLGAPRTAFLLRLALHPELLVLRLEDELLLASARFRLDAARLRGGRLHRLGRPQASQEDAYGKTADRGHHGHDQQGQGFHIRFLPSDRLRVGRARCLGGAIARRAGRVASSEVWAPPWAANVPGSDPGPPMRPSLRLLRSLRRASPRVNRDGAASGRGVEASVGRPLFQPTDGAGVDRGSDRPRCRSAGHAPRSGTDGPHRRGSGRVVRSLERVGFRARNRGQCRGSSGLTAVAPSPFVRPRSWR